MLGQQPDRAQVSAVTQGPRATAADSLFRRMVNDEEPFWHVVHEPFMARDITRDDVRLVIRRGLTHAHGNYKQLLRLFNMQERDYKRFLNFLHKYGCNVPVQRHAVMANGPRRMAPVA